MKNIILLFVFVFTVNLCSAQTTLWIKNNSGVTLDIGGTYTYDTGTCDPDPSFLFDFGPALAVPSGDGCWFEIPAGAEVFKVGGSEPSGPLFGWQTGAEPCLGICTSSGTFSFDWTGGCYNLKINP